MARIKKRIVKVTTYLGEVYYRCERTGRFRTNKWRPIKEYKGSYGCEYVTDAVFGTMKEAMEFMGLHESQILKTEEIVWRSDYN